MDQVAVCRGDRGGICYHVYDGYYYRSDGNNERPHKYLHCTTNGCPGRAVMPSRIEDRTVNNFKMTTLHDHAPSLTSLYINNLKESILARCESEFTSLKQIFDEEMAKWVCLNICRPSFLWLYFMVSSILELYKNFLYTENIGNYAGILSLNWKVLRRVVAKVVISGWTVTGVQRLL